MGCAAGCLALFFPRVTIVLVWLFTDYLAGVYQSVLWPILGFLFLPMTTLAYTWAWHQGDGSVEGIGVVAIVLAVLYDVGSLGGGAKGARDRKCGPDRKGSRGD